MKLQKNLNQNMRKNKKQKKKNAVVQTAVIARINGPNSKRTASSRHQQRVGAGSARTSLARAYISTLNDPFTHCGVQIGFGCLIPTSLQMAYVKSTFIVNATDGSFRIGSLPYICGTTGQGSIGFTSVSGVNTAPAYNFFIASDNGAILANNNFGRIVSGGIRAFVRYPATSQGGILNTYSIGLNSSVPTTNTIQANLSLSQARMSNSDAVSILYRPTDYNDMEFSVLNSTATGGTLSSWQGYIDGIGYPVGSVVYWEAVYHIESYQTLAISSNDIAQDSAFPSLASVFSNVESMMASVRPLLSSENIDGISNLMFGSQATAERVAASRQRLLQSL